MTCIGVSDILVIDHLILLKGGWLLFTDQVDVLVLLLIDNCSSNKRDQLNPKKNMKDNIEISSVQTKIASVCSSRE